MKQGAFITILFLLFESVVLADTLEEHKDCPAPISVIGNHVHTSGELMLSYRFMTMDMLGLQSGTDVIETADVLKDFMMVPTANASEYRHGNTLIATTWGARRVNNWISLSARLLFSHKGNITGNHPHLDINKSPSHRPDFQGFKLLDVAISSNLMVPTGSLARQRLAIEFMVPVYQYLTGTQLKNTWKLVLGWQYVFRLL